MIWLFIRVSVFMCFFFNMCYFKPMRYWVEQTNRRIDQKYPKSDQIHVNTNLVLTNIFYGVIMISNKESNDMAIYSCFNFYEFFIDHVSILFILL